MESSTKINFLPGAIIIPGYKDQRNYTAGIKVWSNHGKIFVKIPRKINRTLQVEIDTSNKTYNVYGHN